MPAKRRGVPTLDIAKQPRITTFVRFDLDAMWPQQQWGMGMPPWGMGLNPQAPQPGPMAPVGPVGWAMGHGAPPQPQMPQWQPQQQPPQPEQPAAPTTGTRANRENKFSETGRLREDDDHKKISSAYKFLGAIHLAGHGQSKTCPKSFRASCITSCDHVEFPRFKVNVLDEVRTDCVVFLACGLLPTTKVKDLGSLLKGNVRESFREIYIHRRDRGVSRTAGISEDCENVIQLALRAGYPSDLLPPDVQGIMLAWRQQQRVYDHGNLQVQDSGSGAPPTSACVGSPSVASLAPASSASRLALPDRVEGSAAGRAAPRSVGGQPRIDARASVVTEINCRTQTPAQQRATEALDEVLSETESEARCMASRRAAAVPPSSGRVVPAPEASAAEQAAEQAGSRAGTPSQVPAPEASAAEQAGGGQRSPETRGTTKNFVIPKLALNFGQ